MYKQAAFCCAPQSLLAEDDLYTEADPVELDDFCRNSDCDDSFFTDIASSLNALGNALVGCASGIEVSIVHSLLLAIFSLKTQITSGS